MADNPVLRRLLQEKAKRALSQHDSKERSWHSESSRTKKIRVLGRVVGSITTNVETWMWLDNPDQSLDIEVTQFDLTDDRISFGLVANGHARIWAWGHVPNVIKADVGGSARVSIGFSGSARIEGRNLTGVSIPNFDSNISDLRFNNDVLNALTGLVEESLNRGWFVSRGDLAKDIAESIEGTSF